VTQSLNSIGISVEFAKMAPNSGKIQMIYIYLLINKKCLSNNVLFKWESMSSTESVVFYQMNNFESITEELGSKLNNRKVEIPEK